MGKLMFVFIALLALFAYGCERATLEEGFQKIKDVDLKYHATIDSYPSDAKTIDLMITELNALEGLKILRSQEQFDLALRYRILSLEAGKFLSEAERFGSMGATGDGFSCKPKPIIIETAMLRQQSAEKSFEAVAVLKELAEKYPNEASMLGLSMKTALFQNATALLAAEQARKDARTIERFCPDEKVLDFYREEFRSKNIMTEEEINSLTYEQAAKKWREIRGI